MNLVKTEQHDGAVRRTIEQLNKSDLVVAVEFVENVIGVRFSSIDEWVEDQSLRDPSATGDDLEELRALAFSINARAEMLPGRRIAKVLRDTQQNSVSPIDWADPTEPRSGSGTPHWPTGCEAIDKEMGGGYGMTVIAGAPKVGKSLMAISSAVEAARSGWSVVYVNAEMSLDHVLSRFQNYMGKMDSVVSDNLHIASVGPGITINTLYEEIKENAIDLDSKRLLIVLDSVNRIADFATSAAGSDDGYWKTLADWSAWAMNSRRTTDGRISWLLVSELSASLEVKGRQLAYTADLLIRITNSGVDDVVEIDIPYSRATKAATIGPAFRDFSTGRFMIHG